VNSIEYAPGRLADVLGEPSQPTALLWHGTQTDSRTAVRLLAEALAERGMGVIAPDWDSHAPDGGRADLLQSVSFARRRVGAAALTLIGWSLGGAAAAGLALRAHDFGVSVARAVCLGGAFMVADPISGRPPLDGVAPAATRPPLHLFVGTRDDVVPASAATEFAAGLRAVDWPVEIVEFTADHGSIAGARYDPRRDRYEPADDPATRAIVADVAGRITDVVRPTGR
jgi:dienelactone hydrolase